MTTRIDLLQGTLELMLLKTLSLQPLHGWGITQRLEASTNNSLRINQGSLYPALERLTRQGLIQSEWRMTENNRRARFYELTAAGIQRLTDEEEAWRRASGVVNAVLAQQAGGA